VQRSGLFSRVKIEKEGFPDSETVILNIHQTDNRNAHFILPKINDIPENMIWVNGDSVHIDNNYFFLPDFLIDKYEVTNKEYKRFVDDGGYQKREYWEFPFIVDNLEVTWEEVQDLIIDQTGQPGPATWNTGDFEIGKENHPVTGISWYEAAAYAKYSGKQLPTLYHFLRVKLRGSAEIAKMSNLSQKSMQVGANHGVQKFGIYDLGGNAREWIYNGVTNSNRKLIFGGGYDDYPYMLNNSDFTQNPMDRYQTNGFRCIKILEKTELDQIFVQKINQIDLNSIKIRNPVSDEGFKSILAQFEYDQTPFNEEIVYVKEGAGGTKTKYLFDAPYFGDRMILYLYTPLNANPPFQTIVYWPGGNAKIESSSEEFAQENQIEYLVKTGRAVASPVYKGSYERGTGEWIKEPILAQEEMVQRFKDLKRSIDFLSTLKEVDTLRFGYYGISWGAGSGSIVLAIENRIKVGVFQVGGINLNHQFVVDYLPRVTQPVLMLNGELDQIFPYKTSQIPFFELLGTPDEHKDMKVYPNGHIIPKKDVIRESLFWFDKYLGPVNRLVN
jgi:dienelactone hydrolase